MWQIAIALSLAGFLSAFALGHLKMLRKNDIKFGLKEQEVNRGAEEEETLATGSRQKRLHNEASRFRKSNIFLDFQYSHFKSTT